MPQMTLKQITADMLDELTDLFLDVFNAPPWNDTWQRDQARIRLRDIMKRPKFFGIAQYDGDRMVGMVMGHGEQSDDGVHFQILELCTANDRKGEGIGSNLLGELTDFLDRQGITAVYLLTMRGEGTEEFYSRHGFRTVEKMCVMSRRHAR